MRPMHIGLVATMSLRFATATGKAQEVGQPGRGLELAQRLCAECHAVRKERTRSPCWE